MRKSKSFRIGRVTLYARGQVWYMRYFENGRRRQVRAGTDKDISRQLAAQVNSQLENGMPAATSFEAIAIPELRMRWLDHHEEVLRSSLATIDRYRAASQHLLNFIRDVQHVRYASHFRDCHAEAFVRYLRRLEVAPNGHPHTAKRRLRDKGIKFVLEVSRTLFNFARKRRHLGPYSENPFTTIQIDRIPIEDFKPIELLTAGQERQFLGACDDWQLPIFATLMLTGLRPGELIHLLLPDDVDLEGGWLHVCNKPALGWQVKTRNERRVPLIPELAEVLWITVGARLTGPLFRRRRFAGQDGDQCPLAQLTRKQLEDELQVRIAAQRQGAGYLTRNEQRGLCRRLWIEMGFVPEGRLRGEFIKLTKSIGLPELTAVKTFRHMFATNLQEGNMDPLIRYQLMGHSGPADDRSKGPLGMTGVYSHATSATIRRQLEKALQNRPVVQHLRHWLATRRTKALSVCDQSGCAQAGKPMGL